MAPPDFPYPSVLPRPPYPAELLFAQRMVSGEECVIGDGKRPEKGIEQGKNANVIRAEVIRFFARGGNEEARVGDDAIKLKGAWVPDELYLTLANIGRALAFFNCHFDEKITMEHAICPALYLDGSRLKGGLKADGIQTNGALCLRNKFSSNGEVRLAGAKIGGDLDCRESTFFAPKNGDLGCRESAQISPQKRAFYADGANIGGGLSLRKSEFQGIVRMHGIHIDMNLDCHGAKFTDQVNVAVAKIKNTLVLKNIKGTGVFNFASTDVERIADDKESREGFMFALDGFTYRQLLYPGNVESRIKWLENRAALDAPGEDSFPSQPFEQAARVLFSMGRDKDARRILFAMENIISAGGETPKPSIVARAWSWLWERTGQPLWGWCGRPAWRWLLKITTGYNYLPSRMLIASTLVVILGAILFGAAEERGYIVPHQPVVLANPEYQKIVRGEETETQGYPANCPRPLAPTKAVRCLLPNYPKFCPFLFSLDVFIPVFSLHQEQYWFPKAPTDTDSWFAKILPFWYWLEIIAGWALVSIFGLTVTGIMQQRQATQSGK